MRRLQQREAKGCGGAAGWRAGGGRGGFNQKAGGISYDSMSTVSLHKKWEVSRILVGGEGLS